jgi:hypothetical protein
MGGAAAPLPIPRFRGSQVVVPAPGPGAGYWVGAPSALLVDHAMYLAYRVRRPADQGRGVDVVVARSDDQLHFEPVAAISKELVGAESLERPALVRTLDGRWRLYLSCATPGTQNWRVEVLEATTPAALPGASPRTVLPGDAQTAVKDPVIVRQGSGWQMWACIHPLDDPEATDRMWTNHAVSDDGLAWRWEGVALRPQAHGWDRRGTRITAVWRLGRTWMALYDGRASAEENFEKRTGLAAGPSPIGLVQQGDRPVAASPHGAGGLRYVSLVALPFGGHRLYYEATCEDGAHELRTDAVLPG